MKSRDKGKAGELELAHEMSRVFGCSARRGQQFSGSPDSPDVITDIHGVHIECKRTEALRLWEAVEQSKRDAAPDEVPLVVHRANRRKWIVIVELDRLPDLAEAVTRFMEKHEDNENG